MDRFRWVIILIAVLQLGTSPAHAQSGGFPNKPVRIIVPYGPGGGNDILARIVAQKLNEIWQQPVVVDNRGGAGSSLGTGLAAQARPDGYTLTVNGIALSTLPALYPNLPYDIERDLAPITLLASQPFALIVHPSVPATTPGELIALAKAKPDQITFGSGGGAAVLATELYRNMTGTKSVHVRYKSGGQAISEVVGGHVQAAISPMSLALPYASSGKVKALAVTAAKRSALAPNLPTLSDSGVAGYEYETWYGAFAPAGVPRAIFAQLNRDIVRALAAPDLRNRLTGMGMEPLSSTPEEFSRYFKAEIARWGRVIREAGIKP